MKNHIFQTIFLVFAAASAARSQSLIDEALRINSLTEGRGKAIEQFNDKYLRIREGSALAIPPHPLYPDSTFYGCNSLDDNILPLAFGFVPEQYREVVADNVIATIRRNRYRADVDPRVEPYVLSTLHDTGHNKMAYFICDEHPELQTSDCISERWKQEWRERHLAGTTISGRGRVIRLRPDFSIQELDTLTLTVMTPRGPVHSHFSKDLMHVEWDLTVPRGIKVIIYRPSAKTAPLLRFRFGGTVRFRGGNHHLSFDLDLPDHVLEESFVFRNEDFPQCHGSTVYVAEDGEVLAGFYGGTCEHDPDTKARLCRKAPGSTQWSRPVVVGEPDMDRYCLDNPVLFRIPEPGEPLLLFYKIRPGYKMYDGEIELSTIAFWEARLRKSYDGGYTWTDAEKLPEGFLGPVKDKPVYHDGRLICGSSYEPGYHHLSKRIHFEWTDDGCRTWHFSEPSDVELSIPCSLRAPGRTGENADTPSNPGYYYGNYHPISSIQPTVFVRKDGTLQALCRTGNGRMSTTSSSDNGLTWSKEVLTDLPQNASGIDGTTLSDGRFVLVYNKFETLPGHASGPRTPLVVAVSDDFVHWTDVVTLEDDVIKEYSYPAVVCDSEDNIHITYTWRRYRIKYVKLRL